MRWNAQSGRTTTTSISRLENARLGSPGAADTVTRGRAICGACNRLSRKHCHLVSPASYISSVHIKCARKHSRLIKCARKHSHLVSAASYRVRTCSLSALQVHKTPHKVATSTFLTLPNHNGTAFRRPRCPAPNPRKAMGFRRTCRSNWQVSWLLDRDSSS